MITNSYRLRWTTDVDAAHCAAALAACDLLPLGPAKDFVDDMFDVDAGNVAPGVTISHLVPATQIMEHPFWRLDGGTFEFVASLDNGHVLLDDLNCSRTFAMLAALSKICDGEDGTIVGAWYAESLDLWKPIMWMHGRLVRCYINDSLPEGRRKNLRRQLGPLKMDGIDLHPENGTAVISHAAFA